MKYFYLIILFLNLGLGIARSSFAVEFRNHPNVTFRPVVCSVLLDSMVASEPQIISFKKLKEDGENGELMIGGELLLADPDAHFAELERSLYYRKKNEILWLDTVKGYDKILAHIRKLSTEVRTLQSQVKQEVQRLSGDLRFSLLTQLAVNSTIATVMAALPLYYFDFHNIPALVALSWLFNSRATHTLEAVKQLGIVPVNLGGNSQLYDSAYLDFLLGLEDVMANNLSAAYSDVTALSTSQLTTMKYCKELKEPTTNLDSKAVVVSCLLQKRLSFERPLQDPIFAERLNQEKLAIEKNDVDSLKLMTFDHLYFLEDGMPTFVTILRVLP